MADTRSLEAIPISAIHAVREKSTVKTKDIASKLGLILSTYQISRQQLLFLLNDSQEVND